MNTLKVEAKLAEKYKYKPLSEDLSIKYRQYYIENIPNFLNINGDNKFIYTLNNTLIANSYNRIVIGDYGAFIEFDKTQSNNNIYIIPQDQKYRVDDIKYSNNVKYIWYSINDNSNIKIYYQKKCVNYADYKPNMYYVSVHEVKYEN